MKILNLYSGIGGNRQLWGDEHEITAIENQQDIAGAYKDFFPNDTVIVADAAEYLLDNYMNYDFIWASPPCQTHSKVRMFPYRNSRKVKKVYPDLTLYKIIIFLKYHSDHLWVVENVNPYYNPLVPPTGRIGRHLFWSNFNIGHIDVKSSGNMEHKVQKEWIAQHGFDLSKYRFRTRKDKIYRNCVDAKLGNHILNCAIEKYNHSRNTVQLFDKP